MTGDAVVLALTAALCSVAWLMERNGHATAAEAWVFFLAGVFFWASGVGSVFWVLIDSGVRVIEGKR
jgi:hypothetical protein